MRSQHNIYIRSDRKMSSLSKAIFISLLLVLLHAQSSSNVYSLGGQSYQYIFGTGAQPAVTLNGRSDAGQNQFVPDSTYIPPPVSKVMTVKCPFNQVYNLILRECVCILGYYMNAGTCEKFDPLNPVCGKNEVYTDFRCKCAYGFFLIGTICDICPPYSAYDLKTLSCNCAQGYLLAQGECRLVWTPPPVVPIPRPPTCGINEATVNGICTCLTNFFLVKGVCTYCVTPNFYDAQLAVCRPTCSQNQQLDLASLTCICVGGFKNINGKCGTCPAYSIFNQYHNRCDCVEGFTFSSGLCIPKTTAPKRPGTLPNPPRACRDLNSFQVNGQCICKPSYYKIAGTCQQCSINTFYDPDLAVCRIPCPANEVYNIRKGQCECAKSFFRIKSICQQCKGDSTYNPVTLTCNCPSGFRSDAAGNCIIGCGVNEYLKNGKCCCKPGFYPVQGVCGVCNWNEVYDQGLGICRIPCDYKRIFDISLKKCVCLPKFFEFADGTCDTCVLYSTYSEITKECVCDAGYVKNLGLCTPSCNAYETFVKGKCLCREGYYLIGYSCGLCPPTQIYDATYRICHFPCQKNEVWDPIIRACRCLPGYYLISGICSQCDIRSQVYSQSTSCCECKEGYKKSSGQGCYGKCSPICSVSQDWILNRCVCKPGFYLINNYCTKCPKGQFYDVYQRICRIKCGINQVYNFDSGKCDCAAAYYIVQGLCSKCQPQETYNEFSQTCHSTPCPGFNEFFSVITYTCICKPRYVRIRGLCTNCNPGQYYDSYSDRCLCKPGYKSYNGFCKPVCPLGSTYINGKCICPNGIPLSNGVCRLPKRCPLYSSWSKRANCCICNSGYRVINGKCSSYQYCGINGFLKYGQCYCKDSFFWILNSCRRCGTNEGFNGVACECYLGYRRDVNGNCAKSSYSPNCYDKERYDSVLMACVCIQGTQFLRGKCETIPVCPPNSYYNSISCICNSGFRFDSNKQCVSVNIPIPDCPPNSFFNGVSCTCNIGVFQQALNACAACPPGTQWNGQICDSIAPKTCLPGYIYNENIGQCEASAPSCGNNAYFNGATCVCLTGFNFISGTCQSCPSSTIFDGSKCASTTVVPPAARQCGTNQVYISNKCVCNSGLYLIKGKCLACPAYTTWNGKFCQCGCDTSNWCLGQPFSQWNDTTKICECSAGNTRVNGLCTQV